MDEVLQRAVEQEKRRARRSRVLGFAALVLLFLPVGLVLATMRGLDGRPRILWATLIAAVLVTLLFALIGLVQRWSGGTVNAIVHPGGAERVRDRHAYGMALAASGRMDDAAMAFEMVRRAHGDDARSLRVEAELFAGNGGDPVRAAELLLRLRRAPDAAPADELYATHRLIDLYLGALNEPGKANMELRRMADRFPNTVDGQSALAELRRRKEDMQS